MLNDGYRNGAPTAFTAEQVTQIVAMACEVQDDKEKGEVSHWTRKHRANEAVKRGFVKKISYSTGRFLNEAEITTFEPILVKCARTWNR